MRTFFAGIPYKWLVAIAFVSGLFMDIMDTTIVNVAIPKLGVHFDAPTTTLQWVITGYLLSLAVWIPASAWFGDRFGTKKVFLFALAVFTLGSALCGLANSVETLIIFRVIQGIGGGMMTPVGTSMLFRAFPPNERAAATAVLIIPTAIAPALGPVLGGWLVDNASWRWIFYVNVPVGILGFIFTFFALREETQNEPGKFDIPGFILSGTGLPLILYALSQGPQDGWTSARVLGTGLLGAALFIALIVVELRTKEPLLHLRIFGDRMFRTGSMAVFAVFAGMMGILFLLPLFLQQLRGLSAFQSGLATFPQALGMVLIAQVVTKLYPKVGPRRLIVAGLSGAVVVALLMSRISLDSNIWLIRGLMFALGGSLGFSMIPVQTATYATIIPRNIGRATALFSTNRQVAGSVAIAVMATVLTTRTKSHVAGGMATLTGQANAHAVAQHGTLLAFHDSFLVASILLALGVVSALFIRDSDAAATMRPRNAPVPEGEVAFAAPAGH
jgi:EmrB/QacA subfamily drug resistance transporter